MKTTRTLLAAAFALPLLGVLPSCGGGESADTPSTPNNASTPATPSEPATPAATEEAAKTDEGQDALEALENEAADALVVTEAARTMYDTYCFTCHGAEGKGDGVAGAALDPKPTDLTSKEWQASVTDDHIRLVLEKGGAAVGKSPLMVPAPGAAGNPDLLNGLTAIVREFGK